MRLGLTMVLLLLGFAFSLAAQESSPPPRQLVEEAPENCADIGYLGVYPNGRPIDRILKSHLKIESGYVLGTLVPQGPAIEAGLKTDDILIRFDGTPVNSFQVLAAAVARKKPRDIVTIEYLREGELRTLQVVLGVRPSPKATLREVRPTPNETPEKNESVRKPEQKVLRSRVGMDEGEMVAGELLLKQMSKQLKGDLDNDVFQQIPLKVDLALGKGLGRLALRRFDEGLLLMLDEGKGRTFSAFSRDGKLLVNSGGAEEIKKLGDVWSRQLQELVAERK